VQSFEVLHVTLEGGTHKPNVLEPVVVSHTVFAPVTHTVAAVAAVHTEGPQALGPVPVADGRHVRLGAVVHPVES